MFVPITWRSWPPLLAGMAFVPSACLSEPDPPSIRVRAEAIIGGETASDGLGLAYLTHVNGDRACSAVLIAPTLLLSAKHCVFRSSGAGDQPLSPEGFVIGFGPSEDRFVRHAAAQVAWIGAPEALSVAEAVAAGEDVAVLALSAPAPPSERVHDVALAFAPTDGQSVRLAGFGLTDIVQGTTARSIGEGRISGYDPGTGIVQVSGDSACYGDSGGPLLSDDMRQVLGILGMVGGSSPEEFCDVELSFAATAANERVRRLIAKECAAVGGCGRPLPAEDDLDGGAVPTTQAEAGVADAGSAGPDASRGDGAADAGSPRDRAAGTVRGDRDQEGSGCSASGRAPAGWPARGLSAVISLVALRRRRSHSAFVARLARPRITTAG